MKKQASLAALLALAAFALPASAKTYYVNADPNLGNDANTGLSTNAPFATIQGAINKAPAGSTILVAPGTYAPIRTAKKLTIKSIDGAETTIIDGTLGETNVPPAIPDYIYVEYNGESVWDEAADDWVWVQGDQVRGYYLVTDVETGAIADPSNAWAEGYDTKPWSPPVDENIWLDPVPKPKTVKTKWGRYTIRSGEVRCTGACVVLGKMLYEDTVWTDGWCERGYSIVSGSSTISGFTLRGGSYGLLGGSGSYCIITQISGLPVGMSSLTDSEIKDNKAGLAGVGYLDTCSIGAISAAATLNRCDIHDNTVNESGSHHGTGFSDCLMFPSEPGFYGTYWGSRASGLYNCLVHGNTGWANNYGSGQAFIQVDVYNSTITGNTFQDGFAVGSSDVGGNVYNSIVWGNVDGDDNPANVRTVVDEKTGRTVAGDFMNYTTEEIVGWNKIWDGEEYFSEPVYGSVERKALCSMMNSLTDLPIEQKGNGKGWMTSGGGSSYDPVWKYRVTYKNSTGNITGDPLFIDPLHGDYHLAPTSPCKDAGADYTKKTGKFDLDSGARKVGKVDMGAYELQPQTAVPADYDGDGKTDAAFYFAASGQWWIFQSRDGLRTISLPDRNAVPCPADYDDEAGAEPAYFTAAAKEPAFVRVSLDGEVLERTAFGAKGATPVAAKLPGKTKATFGVYTANAKKPQFAFQNGRTIVYGAKASRPVAADFDADGKDDLGVYTATASKPAFSILQSSQGYATTKLFQGGPVALGAKGAIPCCADFDGDGQADFATYLSNAKAPYFTRLPSTTQYRETRILPMGSKGDVPVVGVYETEHGPAAPAVWTGSRWTYVKSDYTDDDVRLLGD